MKACLYGCRECRYRSRTEQDASKFLVLGPREKPWRARWLKSPEQHGQISAAEVLRLRATSALLRDQSARRCAQDDDSVGELTERRPLCGSRGAKQVPTLRSG